MVRVAGCGFMVRRVAGSWFGGLRGRTLTRGGCRVGVAGLGTGSVWWAIGFSDANHGSEGVVSDPVDAGGLGSGCGRVWGQVWVSGLGERHHSHLERRDHG